MWAVATFTSLQAAAVLGLIAIAIRVGRRAAETGLVEVAA
jgi:hypothetical protein